MKKQYFSLLLAVIIIIGVIVGSYLLKSMSQRPTFVFTTVKKGKIVNSMQVKGNILPEKTVDLAFEKNGKVSAINFKVGDQVATGTILAQIDASDARDQYKQANFLLTSAKAILAKNEQDLKVQKYELRKISDNSASTYKDRQIQEKKVKAFEELIRSQKAQVSASESNVDFFAHQLSKTVIRAPFAGVVAEKKIEIGQVVAPTIPAVTLISQNNYKIEAYVSQLEVAKIKVGDLAEVRFNNTGAKTQANASVVAIDPMSKTISKELSYKVTLKFTTKDLSVKPGEEVDIEIITRKKDNVLVINKDSLVQKGEKSFVLVKNKNNKTELKPIQLGIQGDNNQVEVVGGLREGDKIVQMDNKN